MVKKNKDIDVQDMWFYKGCPTYHKSGATLKHLIEVYSIIFQFELQFTFEHLSIIDRGQTTRNV